MIITKITLKKPIYYKKKPQSAKADSPTRAETRPSNALFILTRPDTRPSMRPSIPLPC